MDIKAGNAKDKLDAAMNGLVESVYSKLGMVNRFAESDADILVILNGTDNEQSALAGTSSNNEDALNEISQWLELQNAEDAHYLYGRCAAQIQRDSLRLEGNRHCRFGCAARRSAENLYQVRRSDCGVRTSADWLTICANGLRLTKLL